MLMNDVQNQKDIRNINIQRVGVKKVHLPLQILEKAGSYQHVLGEISLSADLSANFRGTHMSRFMLILNRWCKERISSREIRMILEDLTAKLNAKRAEISLQFRYFIEKEAPITKLKGMLDHICHFRGILEGERYTFVIGVEIPVSTVCPCSKEISQYGAHNQRAVVRVFMEYFPEEFVWLEDLIREIEQTGSFEIFPVIKRSDEKFITEKGYENPKFVEDVVRDLVTLLREDPRIVWFEVECEASESIHNHNAFAYQKEIRP